MTTGMRKSRSTAKLRQRTISKFSKLLPLYGTPGAGYFRQRGINKLPTDAIRFCERLRHAGRIHHALYALATDDIPPPYFAGESKAQLGESAKRQKSQQEENYLEYARSVAIRMFLVSSTLGSVEGIETALSCYQIYSVNTRAVMNSNFMKKFRAPTGGKHLVIFADMDKYSATKQAVFECAHANLLAKNDLVKVSVRWPDNCDFNDMLMNGDRIRELVFYKKKAVA